MASDATSSTYKTTSIRLTERQRRELKQLSQLWDAPLGATVRRAVSEALQRYREGPAPAGERPTERQVATRVADRPAPTREVRPPSAPRSGYARPWHNDAPQHGESYVDRDESQLQEMATAPTMRAPASPERRVVRDEFSQVPMTKAERLAKAQGIAGVSLASEPEFDGGGF